MTSFRIGSVLVDREHPSFVMAEAGINHNGQLETALAMVKAAKAAGADCIKFQTFTAEELVLDRAVTYTYHSQGCEVTEPQFEMFKRHEFEPAQWRTIREACSRNGIRFLSTAQNPRDLALLLDLGVEAVKVGSDDLTNLPLLAEYRRAGLPLILSCGMADLAEVHRALEAAGAFDGHPVALLLCTSQYPTPPEDANLRRLATLQAAFPMVVPGFSDHTEGALAAAVAVALGACLFEKHFTLDRGMPGPDHWFSADPTTLTEYVGTIHRSESLLGSMLVRPTPAERDMRALARRSVAAIRPIAAGETLTYANTGTLRPGTGLDPELVYRVIGRRARRALEAGELIGLEDLD